MIDLQYLHIKIFNLGSVLPWQVLLFMAPGLCFFVAFFGSCWWPFKSVLSTPIHKSILELSNPFTESLRNDRLLTLPWRYTGKPHTTSICIFEMIVPNLGNSSSCDQISKALKSRIWRDCFPYFWFASSAFTYTQHAKRNWNEYE